MNQSLEETEKVRADQEGREQEVFADQALANKATDIAKVAEMATEMESNTVREKPKRVKNASHWTRDYYVG